MLKFDDKGLITAVIQDAVTGEVLMVGYMNMESLKLTLKSGEAWFYSRSRKELWHKGATSGSILTVVEMARDCDGDALLFKVKPKGPVCHTGNQSCFFAPFVEEDLG